MRHIVFTAILVGLLGSTAFAAIDRRNLFPVGAGQGVTTPNLVVTGTIEVDGSISQQLRFSGSNGGIDIDADSIGTTGIGLLVEGGLGATTTSRITGPASAFISAIQGSAASTSSPSIAIQSNANTNVTDGVFSINRSTGGFGTEAVTGNGTGWVLGTLLMRDWKSGSGFSAVYNSAWALETYPAQARGTLSYGTTLKEYLIPNGSETLQVVRYVDGSGNEQIPQAILIGGGQSFLSPLVRAHIWEQTAATTTGVAVERLEENGGTATLDAGVNPNQTVYLARAVTTGTSQVIVNDVTTAADNVYMAEFRAAGRCTQTGGASCTLGQVISCVARATVKNVGGTVTVIKSVVDFCDGDVTGGTYTAAAVGCTAQNYCAILGSANACGTGATHFCGAVASPAATTGMAWTTSMTLNRINA